MGAGVLRGVWAWYRWVDGRPGGDVRELFWEGALGGHPGFWAARGGTDRGGGPVLAGYIHDRTGDYELAFQLFLATMGVVVLALLLAKPPGVPPSQR